MTILGGFGIQLLQAGGKSAVDPWWTADGSIAIGDVLAVYQPKGAGTLSDSYINLNNPGVNDAAPGVAPTLDVEGWVFNGSNQYLLSGLTPLETWSVLVRFSDRANTGYVFGEVGIDGSTGRFGITPNSGTGVNYQYGSSLPTVAPGIDLGVLAIAGPTGYRNGVSDTTGMTWSGTPRAIYIGARNLAGSPNAYFQGKIQAIAFYNTILTGTQVSSVTIKMQAL